MDRFKFFTRANIHQPDRRILLEPISQFPGCDKNPGILFMTGLEVLKHFIHVETAVPLTNPGERFLRLKAATAAAADMVATEEGPLRTGINLEDFAHGGLRVNFLGGNHEPKNFWISVRTSTNRSISSVVL